MSAVGTSGLQRRRGGAGANGSASPAAGPSTPTGSGPGGASASAAAAVASGALGKAALTGDHRIAYDPRDLDDPQETRAHPRLTLMDECLLLGLKDRQGYLSFWNDNISYTLRGCILIELALRRRIGVSRDGAARARPLSERPLELLDSRMTGEVLLDETLRLIKGAEPMGAAQWVDLLSGETWNVTKIGFQLKQVRERLAKGLVDKGVLRTEKRNFLLFDMATHPVADSGAKDAVLRRVLTLLTSRSGTLPSPGSLYRDEGKAVSAPATRSLALLCCAFSANVLENALTHLAYDAREAAFQKADDLLADFAQWPMAPRSGAAIGSNVAGPAGGARKPGIGEGSMSTEAQGAGVSTAELAKAVRAELVRGDAGEAQFETIAAVLHVLSRMDSLL